MEVPIDIEVGIVDPKKGRLMPKGTEASFWRAAGICGMRFHEHPSDGLEAVAADHGARVEHQKPTHVEMHGWVSQ